MYVLSATPVPSVATLFPVKSLCDSFRSNLKAVCGSLIHNSYIYTEV